MSISQAGSVTFSADDGGAVSIVVGDGDTTRTVASTGTVFSELGIVGATISDNGEHVAFIASRQGRTGVYRVDRNGGVTIIAEDDQVIAGEEVLGFDCVKGCGVSNSGQVGFSALFRGADFGLRRIDAWGEGGPVTVLQTRLLQFSETLQLNDADAKVVQISTREIAGAVGTGVLGGPFVTVPAPTVIRDYSVNDQLAVAFTTADTNPREVVLRKFGSGQPDQIIASSVGPWDQFGLVSLSDNDLVVFEALLDVDPPSQDSFANIAIGDDPVADLVIRRGDVLDGRTVQFVELPSENAINDLGSVAFVAGLSGGGDASTETVVLRADRFKTLPGPIKRKAQLSTADALGVSLLQNVVSPATDADLMFSLDWLSGDGLLEVLFGGRLLGAFSAADAGAVALLGLTFDTAPGVLSPLEFRLSGGPGVTIALDDILFAGLFNGDFETGYLDGWTVDHSAGGVAFLNGRGALATTPAPVPLPAASGLMFAAFGALACITRRRRGRAPYRLSARPEKG
ncbi:hypothetical protein [Rubrimonas cliftonensis]|uniref:hypothetical protein n=1 Tax=Rubrimonas cliftonensis TaxID=89524 RepID=UPI000B82767A|nr:hypothetical protein [Rubrimonas cliftonensis]